jgi:hypothetical protein
MKRGRIDGQVSKEEYEKSNLEVDSPVCNTQSKMQRIIHFDTGVFSSGNAKHVGQ